MPRGKRGRTQLDPHGPRNPRISSSPGPHPSRLSSECGADPRRGPTNPPTSCPSIRSRTSRSRCATSPRKHATPSAESTWSCVVCAMARARPAWLLGSQIKKRQEDLMQAQRPAPSQAVSVGQRRSIRRRPEGGAAGSHAPAPCGRGKGRGDQEVDPLFASRDRRIPLPCPAAGRPPLGRVQKSLAGLEKMTTALDAYLALKAPTAPEFDSVQETGAASTTAAGSSNTTTTAADTPAEAKANTEGSDSQSGTARPRPPAGPPARPRSPGGSRRRPIRPASVCSEKAPGTVGHRPGCLG